jgi:uncharacterized membrane protein YfcA
MDYVLICLVAFAASLLTFFSGFGLGTLLMPVMALFFPVEIAIALTGVVHFCNNLFKLMLAGRHANKEVLLRFGIPAVVAALAGSWLLVQLTNRQELFHYAWMGKQFTVTAINFLIAVVLFIFSMIELLPFFQTLHFNRNKLPVGGLLSGFFGGLTGMQGALRSAFLIKAGLSKEAFIGTTVVVSTFVDMTRLGVYATRFSKAGLLNNLPLVTAAVFAAVTGAFIGNRLLKKVTLHFLQVTVAAMLLLLSVALGAGWI